MRTTWLCALVSLGACLDDHGKSVVAMEPPDGCANEATLVATTSSTQEVFGPFTLGSTNICLHLDATHVSRAGFGANTDSTDGTSSPWKLELTDMTGALLSEGGDVSIGGPPTRTSASLQQSFTGGSTTDVVLHIAAKSSVAATKITMSFVDPLD